MVENKKKSLSMEKYFVKPIYFVIPLVSRNLCKRESISMHLLTKISSNQLCHELVSRKFRAVNDLFVRGFLSEKASFT